MSISAVCGPRARVRSGRVVIGSVRPFLVLAILSSSFGISGERAFAQSVNGLMSGTVLDQHGRAVVRAMVAVVDQVNATSQTTQSNEDGYFVFAQLRPGTYTLSIEQSGFQRLEKRDILVLTADRLSVGTLVLKVGSSTNVVTVTSETSPVETSSSEQSALISAYEMGALPVIGNDYVALTKIVPGSTYLGNGNNSLGGISSQASFMAIAPPSAAFRGQVRGPITIIWDQIIIHSAGVVLDYLKTVPGIVTERFPPYAPELNPVDRAWFYLKYDRLPNYVPLTLTQLRSTVEDELKQLQRQPKLLRSFIRQSEVPLAF
jgi:transposase